MATVHRAIERGIDGFERVVALKRLLPHLAEDEDFVRAFVREAKLASLLQHGNIVQLYELGRVAASYFISMEYIPGRDLRSMLRQARRVAGPPPVEITIAVLTELLDALDYAHTQCSVDGRPIGLVHRDVSPSNLIVSHTGHLKVIDFGIAKATLGHLNTSTGRIKGKLSYMAPEGLVGRAVDGRSDLFSASVIAHELLTATPLFAAKDDFQIIDRVQNMQPPAPSSRNPSCPPELDEIVLRGLAKDPEKRWRSAIDMRAALADLAVTQRRLATNRDVCGWVEEAFGASAPAPVRRRLPLAAPPGGTPTESRRPSFAGEAEDEVMDIVWGTSSSRSPAPIVLEDVPEVHHHSGKRTLPPYAYEAPLTPLTPLTPSQAHRTTGSSLIVVASPTAEHSRDSGVGMVVPPSWMTSSVRPLSRTSGVWPALNVPTGEQPPGLLEEAVWAARRAEALAIAAMARHRRRSILPLLITSVAVAAAGAGIAWIVSTSRRAEPAPVLAASLPVAPVQPPAAQTPPAQVTPAETPDPAQPQVTPPAEPATPAPDGAKKIDAAREEAAAQVRDDGDRDDGDRGAEARKRHVKARREERERAGGREREDRPRPERGDERADVVPSLREERAAPATITERPPEPAARSAPLAKSGGSSVDPELRPLPVQVTPPVTDRPKVSAAARPRAPLLVPASRTQREGGTMRAIRFPPGEQPPNNIVAKLCIDPRGSITSVTVLSSVSPAVRNAVQRALAQLRFRPVVEAGEKVSACFATGFPVHVD